MFISYILLDILTSAETIFKPISQSDVEVDFGEKWTQSLYISEYWLNEMVSSTMWTLYDTANPY